MDKFELVTRNAVEVLNEDKIKAMCKKKQPVVYCGYEPSGEIHIGHLVTITKLMDFEKAGFHVKVLFADWHAWLNQKGTREEINELMKVWEKGFKAAGLKNAEYVIGSKFQQTPEYITDVFTLSQSTTLNRGLRSMQQVARDLEHAKISQVIYPLMQIVDQKYLKVDVTTSGLEQRKIHALTIETVKQINYETPGYVHTPLIPSLKSKEKMSSSDPSSLISIRDSADDVRKKVRKAHCIEKEVKENPVLMMAQLLVFPRVKKFVIERPEKYGGNLSFSSYEELATAFKKDLHPADLKNGVAEELIKILTPVRKAFGLE